QPAGRWVSMIDGLETSGDQLGSDPHSLENVQLSIIGGQFAVAENGAVWVTSDSMGDRALPFICEHIALVVPRSNIVDTMRHAYERIGSSAHDFGTFIAGPSKTADIEQSLVLGAHGPKSLILFLIS
ncbi:MAG TPA: LUD domain-containing protein, partial [Chryseolinea sp.]|nr:LUD domain-containing protein [Chryseolinea sp.]